MSDITVGDIVTATSLPVRTVQFWTDAGVLKPNPATDRKGSGKHRRYKRRELRIAMALSRLKDFGMTVGVMAELATYLRTLSSVGNEIEVRYTRYSPDVYLRFLF
jgi:DNA-binding transcriptional MerR regulator